MLHPSSQYQQYSAVQYSTVLREKLCSSPPSMSSTVRQLRWSLAEGFPYCGDALGWCLPWLAFLVGGQPLSHQLIRLWQTLCCLLTVGCECPQLSVRQAHPLSATPNNHKCSGLGAPMPNGGWRGVEASVCSDTAV
jgi:hypothetical protein